MTLPLSETAIVTIERIVAGGYGLARYDGRVLLVPLTAPGDEVEVELPEHGSRACLVRLISSGPDRITPPCRHYGECGGCDLMHISYPAQVQAKLKMVIETINRIGGPDLVTSVSAVAIEANPMPLATRIRATWQPTRSGGAGYFRRGSHDVVEIDHCPILDPILEATRTSLRIDTRAHALTNGTAVSLSGDGQLADVIEFTVAGEHICGSADVFFQASAAVLDNFVRHVVHLGARGHPNKVLELYSGIGLFTVPLARLVGEIRSVESYAAAVEFARMNVNRAALANVRCHAEKAERWLGECVRTEYRPDTILVDPPRAGLSVQVANGILTMAPGWVVYVSCDPATFARDARRLVDGGYCMSELTVFDLFPQTHHVELVAAFYRR